MPSYALSAFSPADSGPTRASTRILAGPSGATLASPGQASSEEAARWESLVARMRTRDTAAFETAMNLTRDTGWRLACQELGDPHLAQDALQEAYLVVFTRIHTLREPAAFRGWFLRIVVNQCRNARRSRREDPVAEPPEAPAARDCVDTRRSPAFDDEVTRRLAVSSALRSLTPLERTSILLRDYLQLSYQEMAEALSVPLGTVKSRLNEARKQLVRRLKGADVR